MDLAEARRRLLDASIGPGDTSRIAMASKPAPPAAPVTAHVDVQVGVGDHTAAGAVANYHDKRTGEWKARATGGRRLEFPEAMRRQLQLFDHHLDRGGKKLGRRKQETNLFITINTNKRTFMPTRDPERMRQVLDTIFKDMPYAILRFGPLHPLVYAADAEWPDDVIEGIFARCNVEVGPKSGALHCHVWFRVCHWSQIQVHKTKLQLLFKRLWNEGRSSSDEARIKDRDLPAVQIKLCNQSDWAEIIGHYLTKQLKPLES